MRGLECVNEEERQSGRDRTGGEDCKSGEIRTGVRGV